MHHVRGVMSNELPVFAILLACAACGSNGAPSPSTVSASTPSTDAAAPSAAPAIWVAKSPAIDPTALPLRDQAYVTTGPKKGFMYVCEPRMFQQTDGPGAFAQGDWLNKAGGTFDMTKKVFVQGSVEYPSAVFTVTTSGEERKIAGNGLPVGATTGVFPVAASDPAHAYDPNPNPVRAQTISFSIPRNPRIAPRASCTYKQVGITLDGIQIHSPLDSQGRDELAYQLQDACTGASQPGGAYHRHALSDCAPHIHEHNALVGYALDGFGIFSPYDEDGRELVSADLDECHGITSEIEWEGQIVTMYHYVMTRDFPYTVACFRGTPTRNAFPSLPGAPPER